MFNKNKDLKILIVGAGDYPIYEKAFFQAFKMNGYENCELVTWNSYYCNSNRLFKLLKRIELHYAWGLQTSRFNNELVKKCMCLCPDLVFLYSCRMVYSSSVKRIRKLGCYIASYCNDDPFSDYFRKYFWRHYRKSLKSCDQNYVYRIRNIKNIVERTGKEGKLLRSYYIKEKNFPCKEDELLPDTPEIIFLGHMENDERLVYINALTEMGITVGLNEQEFGEWGHKRKNIVFLDNPREKYNQYICSCKIPLVFLSKINHDTYTRRCFEIPAAGAFLFCPYTDDLATMFKEDKEVVFFRNKQDFIDKIKYYLVHDEERKRIADAGRARLRMDGHEASDRIRQIIWDFEESK